MLIPEVQIRKENTLISWRLLLIITLFLFLISPVAEVNAQTPVPLIFTPNWGAQMYVGESWSQTFTATGGIGNYTYAITSGNIPGVIVRAVPVHPFSGTPTTRGSYPITIRVTDSPRLLQTRSQLATPFMLRNLSFSTRPGERRCM